MENEKRLGDGEHESLAFQWRGGNAGQQLEVEGWKTVLRKLTGLLATGILIAISLAVAAPLVAQVTSNNSSQALAGVSARGPLATRTFVSAAGRWSVEIPDSWNVFEQGPTAIFRSYDLSAPYEREKRAPELGPIVPQGHVRIAVSVFGNPSRMTASQAADGYLAAPDPSRGELSLVSRRDDLVVSGQPATVLVLQSTIPGRDRVIRRYFAVSAAADRFFSIEVNPDRTTWSSDVDHFFGTLTIQ
jgi:hypothetical protein